MTIARKCNGDVPKVAGSESQIVVIDYGRPSRSYRWKGDSVPLLWYSQSSCQHICKMYFLLVYMNATSHCSETKRYYVAAVYKQSRTQPGIALTIPQHV